MDATEELLAKAKKVKPRVLKDGTLCYLSKPFKEESLIVCLNQDLNPGSALWSS